MREGPCFTVFPALKHHLVQYRGSTNNEHLGFLDLFDVWSIITYVPNTNSSIAPCHYGENFSHLKWYPLSLPSTPHVSEVLVAQTRWLVLLGKRGARTVDANNEMCVTCLGGNKFPWSMFRTQTVTPPPTQGACALAAQPMCHFLKVNKSLNISCHFSTCDLWICFMKCVIMPPGRKRAGSGEELGIPSGPFAGTWGL